MFLLRLTSGVGVAVGVGAIVGVGLGVAGIAVALRGVEAAVAVAVGRGVSVGLGVSVGFTVGCRVAVRVGLGVSVGNADTCNCGLGISRVGMVCGVAVTTESPGGDANIPRPQNSQTAIIAQTAAIAISAHAIVIPRPCLDVDIRSNSLHNRLSVVQCSKHRNSIETAMLPQAK